MLSNQRGREFKQSKHSGRKQDASAQRSVAFVYTNNSQLEELHLEHHLKQ